MSYSAATRCRQRPHGLVPCRPDIGQSAVACRTVGRCRLHAGRSRKCYRPLQPGPLQRCDHGSQGQRPSLRALEPSRQAPRQQLHRILKNTSWLAEGIAFHIPLRERLLLRDFGRRSVSKYNAAGAAVRHPHSARLNLFPSLTSCAKALWSPATLLMGSLTVSAARIRSTRR